MTKIYLKHTISIYSSHALKTLILADLFLANCYLKNKTSLIKLMMISIKVITVVIIMYFKGQHPHPQW